MKPPYEECKDCIATKWCKRYSGESLKPSSPSWCNPKFRLDKALEMSEIPKRYLNANIYKYTRTNDNQPIYERIKPYLKDILNAVDEGKNFMFRGIAPGTGKTFHASTLLNQFIYKACLTNRMDFENPLAFYISYTDLMDHLRYHRKEEYVTPLVETIKNVPLLLLDDVGAGTTSGFTDEQTFMIINYRYNNNLSTIYTMNLDKKMLMEALNTRLVSRIFSNCEDIEFTSKKDWR